MAQPLSVIRTGAFLGLLVFLLSSCDSSGPLASVGRPPTDSTPTPGPDSVVPPPDSIPTPPPPPPPPPTDTGGPPVVPVHHGIPLGPTQIPPGLIGREYSGTIYTANTSPSQLLADLEMFRRAYVRIFVSFTGNESYVRDANGFSMRLWKERVDRFRGINITSYITDGTLMSHRLLDEPSDRSNWFGDQVTQAEIEEMARYSKEVWPGLATSIRVVPAYLKGYSWKYLDAAWASYAARFGDLGDYLSTNIRDAKEVGLGLVGGLNAVNGGKGESGIPGRKAGKWAMSANELRNWGRTILAEPTICAFALYQHDATYWDRPEIKAAVEDLVKMAADHPKTQCRP